MVFQSLEGMFPNMTHLMVLLAISAGRMLFRLSVWKVSTLLCFWVQLDSLTCPGASSQVPGGGPPPETDGKGDGFLGCSICSSMSVAYSQNGWGGENWHKLSSAAGNLDLLMLYFYLIVTPPQATQQRCWKHGWHHAEYQKLQWKYHCLRCHGVGRGYVMAPMVATEQTGSSITKGNGEFSSWFAQNAAGKKVRRTTELHFCISMVVYCSRYVQLLPGNWCLTRPCQENRAQRPRSFTSAMPATGQLETYQNVQFLISKCKLLHKLHQATWNLALAGGLCIWGPRLDCQMDAGTFTACSFACNSDTAHLAFPLVPTEVQLPVISWLWMWIWRIFTATAWPTRHEAKNPVLLGNET